MGGGIARLARDIGQRRALEIALTASTFSAQQGLTMGFVNRLSAPGAVLASAQTLASQIAKGAPLSLAASQAIARRAMNLPLEDALDPNHYPEVMRVLSSDDAQEGRRAFIERRNPTWRGK